MKLNDWLVSSTKKLDKAGVGTARLDCLVLLKDATGKNRAWLLAHPETPIARTVLAKLERQIEERKKHVPLAQIRGKTEFYGREFMINQDVLEPRPESETMIDLLKDIYKNHAVASNLYTLVDVGTGSGAIGITAKLEIPEVEVIMTDIDPACLTVARQNAKKYSVDTQILHADLLEGVPPADVILANLPYVPDSYEINQAALNEPKIAIFGGPDGLDLYRKMFAQTEKIAKNLQKPRYILTESLPFQHKDLAKVAQSSGYKQIQEDDFIQVFQND